MMRMLMIAAIVLSANVVSAQEFFELPPPPSATETEPPRTYAEDEPADVTLNYPYVQLTEIRLWAPLKDTGEYCWWKLVREHRGPGWKRSGLFMKHVDDVVIDMWVPEEPAQKTKAEERQPIRHTTIDVWKLRDEELKKMEAREQKPKRLIEPVFRIQKSQTEEQREEEEVRTSPPQKKAPSSRSLVPEKKPTPTQPRQFQPRGTSVLVFNSSAGK